MKKTLKKIMASALAVAMTAGMLDFSGTEIVKAQDVTKTITALGAGDISAPDITGELSKWDIVEFGSYPQELKEWTKQPIKWRILSYNSNSGDALLLADKVLDGRLYNENECEITWEECSLRKWLNAVGDYANDETAFLNAAFTAEEKRDIVTSNVAYPDKEGSDPNTSSGSTEERVYLLSVDEVSSEAYGFNTSFDTPDNARIASPTDYAKTHKVDIDSNTGICYWWLRSPGDDSKKAAVVSNKGCSYGYGYVHNNFFGIRPALRINLEASQNVSYAGKVSSDGNFEEAATSAVPEIGYSNPVKDNHTNVTTWDCVYFGNYYQDAEFVKKPIEWRVLSMTNDDLFLLADKALDCKKYNETSMDVTWKDCTLRKWLNDDAKGFYNTAFAIEEKAVIVSSDVVNDNNPHYRTEGGDDTKDWVYLLSIGEASKASYGFNASFDTSDNARIALATDYAKAHDVHTNSDTGGCILWLRSPGQYGYQAADVGDDGKGVFGGRFVNFGYAIRPALHINLKSVIAVTKVESEGKSVKSKYRLTLHDDKMQISTGTGNTAERNGNEITVPYTITGDNRGEATQVSVLLLNYESGNTIPATSSANDLPEFTYKVLDTGDDFATSGSGKFTLPEEYRGKKCGVDYFAYIMAEDVNVTNRLVNQLVDFASAPVPFNIAEHYFSYTAGTGDSVNVITASCIDNNCSIGEGETKGKIKVTLNAPKGANGGTPVYDGTAKTATITGYPENEVEGLASAPVAGDIQYFKATATGSTEATGEALAGAPTDVGDYVAALTWGSVTVKVPFTIAKADAEVSTAPAAKTDIKANGTEQELVTAGKADGGTLYYAMGTDTTTVPETGWSTDVPKGKDAKTYYVWYKLTGDANHNDIAAKCITVTIASANNNGSGNTNNNSSSTPGGGGGGSTGATGAKEKTTVSGNTAVSDNKVTSGNSVTSGNNVTSGNSADKGAIEKETITNSDGTVTITEKTTGTDGSVTTTSTTTDASGKVTTIQVEKKTGKITETETFAVKDPKKKTVELVKATTNAKSGEVFIPKTITSDGKTYKVTALKKGMLKGSKKKARTVSIDASAIKKVEAGAFDGMAKKGKIALTGSKKQCKILKKKIKKSGLPKGVTIEKAGKTKKK